MPNDKTTTVGEAEAVSPASAPHQEKAMIYRCRCGFTVGADIISRLRVRGIHRNAVGVMTTNDGCAYCPICDDETLVEQPAGASAPAPPQPEPGMRDSGDAALIDNLSELVYWLLGERDSFPEKPEPIKGRWSVDFWWRLELRSRLNVIMNNPQTRPVTTNDRLAAAEARCEAMRKLSAEDDELVERVTARADAAEAHLADLQREVQALRDNLMEIERHCPCGARPDSPKTHPHVGGCPVYEALKLTETLLAALPDPKEPKP